MLEAGWKKAEEIMSKDARNSIFLWAASLIAIGILWIPASLDVMPVVPDGWILPILGLLLLLNVIEIGGLIWKRRSRNDRGGK